MKDKVLQKIMSDLDKIRGDWETHVSEVLNSFEMKYGLSLNEIDEEKKNEILQHMGWLEENIRLLKMKLKNEKNIG